MRKLTDAKPAVEARFFRSPDDLRQWFEANHTTVRELWVGYYKKGSGESSITWPESVDEALCCGWIDGMRKSVDGRSYKIRFTPRRPASVWSNVNVERFRALTREGRMRPEGTKAFLARRENRSGIYSYEQRPAALVEPYAGLFRKHPEAWDFFQARPPSYRKVATWWIISAKQEATRLKRLEKLIDLSARGRVL